MTYTVIISSVASKFLRKLPKKDLQGIAKKIELLEQDPRPNGVKKLSGEENIYRIRSGDYRIIYEIEDKVLKILVSKIGHRKEIYRD